MNIYVNGMICFKDKVGEKEEKVLNDYFKNHYHVDIDEVEIEIHRTGLASEELNKMIIEIKETGNEITGGTLACSGDYDNRYVFRENAWVYEEPVYLTDLSNHDILNECKRRNILPKIPASRLKSILIDYIDNDLESADPGYVREVIENICTIDEIKMLGLHDWLGFNE